MPVAQRLIHDARFAVRMLRRQPEFTVPAIASLTLGIAASALIFTFVKAVFMPALPVKDPSELVLVYSTTRGRTGELIEYQSTSYLNAKDYQIRNTVFASLAVIVDSVCTLDRGDRSSQVILNLTTADYFDVLGVRPSSGRTISREDDNPNSPPVVVVSHALWTSQLGSDDRVLGTSMRLNGNEYTIIGVMPPELAHIGALPAADVWVPMVWHDQLLAGNIRSWYNLRAARVASMVARLKPRISLAEAASAMSAIGSQLQQEYPKDNAGRNVMLVPLAHTVVPASQRTMYVRAGLIASMIVAVVLLIACSNVAHLLLARASQRRQEFSIRMAIGASRRDVVGQLLVEGLLLACLACTLGLLLAYAVRDVATAVMPGNLRANLDFTLDGRVLLFTAGTSALSTVIFAFGPALRASRSIGTFHPGAGETRSTGSTGGVHRLLVAAQVGLAVVALVTASLFIRSLRAAERTDLGFDLDRQVVTTVDLASLHYPLPRVRAFYEAVVQRLGTLPGVANVAVADAPPLSGSFRRTVFPAETDISDPSNGRLVGIIDVTPRFFETVGMPVLRGRDFDDRDDVDRPMVAVVNQAAAKTLWPGEDPIGKRVRFLLQDWDVSVIGVVTDVTYARVTEAPQPIIYAPLKQHLSSQATVYVNVTGDVDAAAKTIRSSVTSLEPALSSTRIRTGKQVLDQVLTERRIGAQALGSFGMAALLLAVLGTYGVVSYTVVETRREIGIRVALGSSRGEIFRRALAHSLAGVVAGVVLGLFFAAIMTRLVASLLFGVGRFDPISFAGAAALLLATALVACAVPVWRATGVDPTIVLRVE
ncbi:MAG TPA: ABC transporter permease [Vicinamibacterales bacterium]|nr:ABC transporter permease [Vicinamibacterales bacterium]